MTFWPCPDTFSHATSSSNLVLSKFYNRLKGFEQAWYWVWIDYVHAKLIGLFLGFWQEGGLWKDTHISMMVFILISWTIPFLIVIVLLFFPILIFFLIWITCAIGLVLCSATIRILSISKCKFPKKASNLFKNQQGACLDFVKSTIFTFWQYEDYCTLSWRPGNVLPLRLHMAIYKVTGEIGQGDNCVITVYKLCEW